MIDMRRLTAPSPRYQVDEGDNVDNIEDVLDEWYTFPSDPHPRVADFVFAVTDILVKI